MWIETADVVVEGGAEEWRSGSHWLYFYEQKVNLGNLSQCEIEVSAICSEFCAFEVNFLL